MWLNVYARLDGVLVVVPALFQVPVALERSGPLQPLGTADLDLTLIPDAFIEAIGASGYAEARGEHELLIRGAVDHRSAMA